MRGRLLHGAGRCMDLNLACHEGDSMSKLDMANALYYLVMREYKRRSKLRNREINRISQLVIAAIKAGEITQERCVICGSLESECHHPDYDFPVCMVWLCRTHHKEVHAKSRLPSAVTV